MDGLGEFHQKVFKVLSSNVELRILSDTTLVECIKLDMATTKKEILEVSQSQIEVVTSFSLASMKELRETNGTKKSLLIVPVTTDRP